MATDHLFVVCRAHTFAGAKDALQFLREQAAAVA